MLAPCSNPMCDLDWSNKLGKYFSDKDSPCNFMLLNCMKHNLSSYAKKLYYHYWGPHIYLRFCVTEKWWHLTCWWDKGITHLYSLILADQSFPKYNFFEYLRLYIMRMRKGYPRKILRSKKRMNKLDNEESRQSKKKSESVLK